jgi:hypothetical protein
MFKILNGREHFYQWDINQKLLIEDASIVEVHFCNKTESESLVCEVYTEDGQRVVNVPNILLQDNWDICVYAFCGDYTKHSERFKVVPRSKPADYVYTETEIKTFELLEARMDELESTVSSEGVANAVKEYLEENPIEVGATAEEAAQIKQNTADIKELQEREVDLSEYALKSEIPNVSNYITMAQVEAKGYQTAEQVNSAINVALGVIENGTY